MNKAHISTAKAVVYPHHLEEQMGEVIGEAAVSLTVNGEVWLTFMCTSIELDALAVGFLYNEGIIQKRGDIADLRVCPGLDNVDVWLKYSVEKPQRIHRTSGCTGGVTFLDANQTLKRKKRSLSVNGWTLSSKTIFSLVADLIHHQNLYDLTGGVHTSALYQDGQCVFVAEDVGRHNTLDKLAGKCVLQNAFSDRYILVTTGRISSEMLQKAGRIGASVVISRTSPTSLSVQLAEKAGITLIGYARRDRFTIYTHAQRISLQTEVSSEKK